MKRLLLIGSWLLLSLMAFPQNLRPRPSGVENMAKIIANRIYIQDRRFEVPASEDYTISDNSEIYTESPSAGKTASFSSVWNVICSSSNPYGVTLSSSKPLQYNEELNAVTFVYNAGMNYVSSPPSAPAAKSGVLVTKLTQDWGSTWDSTCVWNDDNHWARHPQGALLNAPGNWNIYDARMVGTAAISNGTSWTGNGFFSKKMGAVYYNNVAPSTNSFIPTLSPELGKTDFTVYDFQAMDNNKVVGLGYINNDLNGTADFVFGYRGARVVKGSFVSGGMVWDNDSIIPAVVQTNGNKELIAKPRMAWSEDGQVGYVMHIGVAANAIGNNFGYQPLLHRTNDGGGNWTSVNGIDFNLPAMSTVTNMLLPILTDTHVVIPFFNYNEGFGLTVDKDNKLHILGTVFPSASSHPDSLGYTRTNWLVGDAETYRYRHTPGLRPYVFDFTGNGLSNSPWAVTLVDSMSSEQPGINATTDVNGYAANPWVPLAGNKVEVEARFQSSRTPDGKYIVHTWAESDTSITINGFKWNEVPNVKARLIDVTAQTLHTLEINVTKPGNNNPFLPYNLSVANRAYLHYVSPKCALAQYTPVGPNGPIIVLPITCSRPYGTLSQTVPTIHRYMSALLNFGGVSPNDVALPIAPPIIHPPLNDTTGIVENALKSINMSYVFPNPANGSANLYIDLKDQSKVELSVVNMVGQTISTAVTTAQMGQNTIPVNISGLSKGVYMVNVKIANSTSTKKLIVE